MFKLNKYVYRIGATESDVCNYGPNVVPIGKGGSSSLQMPFVARATMQPPGPGTKGQEVGGPIFYSGKLVKREES